jgi:epoxyqueuosine reductase
MKVIADTALQELQKHGFKAKTFSITHLPELQEDVDRLIRDGMVSKAFQETYLQFKYNASEVLPGVRTVFIVAIPQPVTRATFVRKGNTYRADVPPTYIGGSDEARVKDVLTGVLEPAGYRFVRASLPVKTLAVRSGLAQYGRNNITYVAGFGSFHRLMPLYTDCPHEKDSWQELKVMKVCENCFACLENCPTHSILPDRFLIDAERCLTRLNEVEGAFPDWVLPHWHNALVGCMLCQVACPVDKANLDKIIGGPRFTEEETGLLLQKTPVEKLPEETRQKLADIAFDEDYNILARNLEVLINKADSL